MNRLERLYKIHDLLRSARQPVPMSRLEQEQEQEQEQELNAAAEGQILSSIHEMIVLVVVGCQLQQSHCNNLSI